MSEFQFFAGYFMVSLSGSFLCQGFRDPDRLAWEEVKAACNLDPSDLPDTSHRSRKGSPETGVTESFQDLRVGPSLEEWLDLHSLEMCF